MWPQAQGMFTRSSLHSYWFQPHEDDITPLQVIQANAKAGGDPEQIWMTSLNDRYHARPATPDFEHMCLATFASVFRLLSASQLPASYDPNNQETQFTSYRRTWATCSAAPKANLQSFDMQEFPSTKCLSNITKASCRYFSHIALLNISNLQHFKHTKTSLRKELSS